MPADEAAQDGCRSDPSGYRHHCQCWTPLCNEEWLWKRGSVEGGGGEGEEAIGVIAAIR